MGFLWFWIVGGMIVAYVIFDGFDIGVGIVRPFVAHDERERQLTLRSIGPVWDGNEVWLIAAGGTLFFAFPLVYAVAFSGFYLALMIVLWLLIARALGIELRMHVDVAVWRTFFDGLFFISSALLAVFFGAALANVIRGVPLQPDGYFFLPLWTNWRLGAEPGILDWYTVTGGVLAVAALSLHGALYLALKTEGSLQQRSRDIGRRLWAPVLILTLIGVPASMVARPDALNNYVAHPLLFVIPVAVLAALAGIIFSLRRQNDRNAFLCSCTYLGCMLVGAGTALYPKLLPSTGDPVQAITTAKALAGAHTLRVGLAWWVFGIALAVAYFVVVYGMFRGKVRAEDGGYGH